MSRERRRAPVERSYRRLSVVRQCNLLGLSRSSVSYRCKPTMRDDLELMASMACQYLAAPCFSAIVEMDYPLGASRHVGVESQEVV